MQSNLHVLLALIVACLFGMMGALITGTRGRHPAIGFLLGLVGPVGWIVAAYLKPRSGPSVSSPRDGGARLEDNARLARVERWARIFGIAGASGFVVFASLTARVEVGQVATVPEVLFGFAVVGCILLAFLLAVAVLILDGSISATARRRWVVAFILANWAAALAFVGWRYVASRQPGAG